VAAFQAGQSFTGAVRYPFNGSSPGVDWTGEGRGCNTATGSFGIDAISYAGNGTLERLELNFEQHCEGGPAPLVGQVRYVASDTTPPPGPVEPPPAGLWTPTIPVPASGNYILLQSDTGDFIGAGRNYTYTGSVVTARPASAGLVSFYMDTGTEWWSGDFKGMSNLTELTKGYYGGLERFPFHNPITGGLSWSGTGRGCNTLRGWFVIDDIAYVSGALARVKLRFEQHCEGGSAALRGQVYWAR
jgi:hypothetical protein